MSKKFDKNKNRNMKMMFQYMIGHPVDRIASGNGVSTATLYQVLKANNIPLKTERDAREYFKKKVFTALTREKKTVSEISAEMGLPSELIGGFIKYEYELMEKKKEKEQSVSKPKTLGKAGLIGSLPSSQDKGVRGSQTSEEKQVRDSFNSDKEKELEESSLINVFEGDFSDEDEVKLVLLRELLRYAASINELDDYSNDPLLLPEYLLPIDIVISKDMVARVLEGYSNEEIATIHRTDVELVDDLIQGGLDRNTFRDRFIKSLIKRGLIVI